ncbi:ABC transporter substrate-binding protein [Roseomonas sp. BN140053]|uniref:ABC transporter substrate-binding protein n=1 Tax=Roseomonas sp. BN140053 TaxID=3391898 RepID=UPI0039E7B109
MQRFHVSATGHSLNYLPEYVARWQGFFAEEGLNVSASVPSPWDLVLDDIGAGRAEAALGGIWVPSMYLGRGPRYTPFAQVSARAPLALVGRRGAPAFSWEALPGKVILMKGSNGASVGLFIKMLLREHGVDPVRVGFVQDLDGKMLAQLFAGGMGDYLVVDSPSALTLEAAGGGVVATVLAASGGDVPWSVYYAPGESDAARLAVQRRFVRALGRGMDWVLAHEAAEFRGFLVETFPRFDPDHLVRLVELYRAHGMWTTPRIDVAGYARWQRGIADGHLTAAPLPYEVLIDGRATEVSAAL